MRVPSCIFLLLLAFAPSFGAGTVAYVPPASPSPLSERWRWNELEALQGREFVCVAEDEDETLWFADREGIHSFDGVDLESRPYPDGRTAFIPHAILASRGGGIFVSHVKGIYCFENGEWRRILEYRRRLDAPQCLLELDNGAVLVGNKSGLYLLYGDQSTLLKRTRGAVCSLVKHNDSLWFTEEKTGRIYRCFLEAGVPVGSGTWSSFELGRLKKGHRSICVDGRGTLWATSADDSSFAFVFDEWANEWTPVHMGLDTGTKKTPEHWIDSLPNGDLVIRLADSLVYQSQGQWAALKSSEYLAPNRQTFFLKRKNGNCLIGGPDSNVYEIDTSNQRWTSYSDLVFQCETRDGNLWFISLNGEIVTNHPRTGEWRALPGCIDTPAGLVRSSDDTVWAFGSDGERSAAAFWRGDGWVRERYPELGFRFSYDSACVLDDGDILLGNGSLVEEEQPPGNEGMIRLRREGDSMRRVDDPRLRSPERRVRRIGWSKQGDLLIAGQFGLFKQEDKPGAPFRTFLDGFDKQMKFKRFLVDRQGALWIPLWGTGLYRFESRGSTLFDRNSQLDLNRVVYLLQDRQLPDGVIAATQTGIARFQEGEWSHMPFGRGLVLSREKATLRQSEDGSIWINQFANPKGQNPVRTIRYTPEKTPPVVRFTTVPDKIAESGAAYFAWRGIDPWGHTPADSLRYSFRFGSGEWSPFSSVTNHTIAMLPAGDHRFEVRAKDLDGNMQAAGAAVAFSVIPPVWKRPWFVATLSTLLALVVFLIVNTIRIRIRHIREIEEVKLSFFTQISHELRTPLTVIAGPLESALSKIDQPAIRDQLALALKGAKKTIRLVDQLLDFRKYEGEDPPARTTEGDFVEFLREVVSLHEFAAREKRQTLLFHSQFERLVVELDEEKLCKIVNNLLSNAIKYTPPEGVVRVELSGEPAARSLNLSVTDTGVGIAPDEQERIFDPFYRAGSVDWKKEEKGTGLGLSLVRSLAKSLHGRIEVESPAGETGGTRFTLRLPWVEAKDSPEGIERPSSEASDREDRAILIADDDPDIRAFLRQELGDTYRILEAEDGSQALELARSEIPDLILTDVMMPEMDGRELCKAVKADDTTNHIPVIMLTALGSDREAILGLEARADDYVAKPIRPAYLKLKIQNRLETRSCAIQRFREDFLKPGGPLKRPGAESIENRFVSEAMGIIRDHLADPNLGVPLLSEKLGTSRYTLGRKIKAVTGETPVSLIQKLRLKRAAELLLEDVHSVSEIADCTGFSDASYFGKLFKAAYHCRPSAYKAQFERNARASNSTQTGGASHARGEALRESGLK